MKQLIGGVAVVAILVLAHMTGQLWAQQVERGPRMMMWLLQSRGGEKELPKVHYYKFQVKDKLTCVAVFERFIPQNYCHGDCAYSPAIALTSHEVPCE